MREMSANRNSFLSARRSRTYVSPRSIPLASSRPDIRRSPNLARIARETSLPKSLTSIAFVPMHKD